MNRNVIAVLLAGAALLCSCWEIHREKPVRETPVVKVMQTSRTDAQVSSCAYVGTVESARSVTLVTNNPGTIGEFRLKAGDRVRAGQVVAKVESQSIRSAYLSAQSTLEQARDGYDRLSKAYESGSVPEVKMVELRTKLTTAQAAFDAAQKALWHCTVTAPFSGVVSESFAENGTEAGLAAPLVRIVDTEALEISFPVPENEVSSMKAGDRLSVEVPAVGCSFDAVLKSKGVVASRLSHSYDCVASVPAGIAGLMPGMVCKLRVRTLASGALVIPASAVLTDGNGRYVWTVDENNVVGREYIKVGGYSGRGIVVEEGLDGVSGVIVEGGRKVSTGMKVKIAG